MLQDGERSLYRFHALFQQVGRPRLLHPDVIPEICGMSCQEFILGIAYMTARAATRARAYQLRASRVGLMPCIRRYLQAQLRLSLTPPCLCIAKQRRPQQAS